ncbi:MAG: hypothetical protein ABFC57_18170 [Veillonellales bacterium]
MADTSFSGVTLLDNKVQTGVFGFAVQSIGVNRFWYMRHDFTSGYSEAHSFTIVGRESFMRRKDNGKYAKNMAACLGL